MTRHHNGDARVFPGPTLPHKLLQVALVVSGVACIGLYPETSHRPVVVPRNRRALSRSSR